MSFAAIDKLGGVKLAPNWLTPRVFSVNDCFVQERHWESNWTIDAIWEVIYLAVLMAVCVLLRPSMNSQRCEWAREQAQMSDVAGILGCLTLRSFDR